MKNHMEPYKTIWNRSGNLFGLICYQKNKENWKNPKFLWVGRRKCKLHFHRLGFRAVPRMLKNRKRKDDHMRMGEGRPLL